MADPAANNWPAPQAEQPVGPTLTNSIPTIVSGNWQAGITYTPECPEGQTLSLYVYGTPKTPTNRPDAVTWIPYILKFYEECSSFSNVTEDDISRAKRGLRAVSEKLLGAELWDGTISQSENWQGAATPNTWLSNAPLTLDGSIVPAAQGLACLDAYLQRNNSGQQGVIHAPAEAFDAWVVDNLVQFRDGRAYSPLGHLIVSSPGYPGTAPDGSSYPAGLWAYATDMLRIFMTEPKVHDQLVQIVDRDNNTTAIMAERIALAEWPRCRHAAIGMDIDVCDLV